MAWLLATLIATSTPTVPLRLKLDPKPDPVAERYHFLCDRLEEGRTALRAWWSTWMAVYSGLVAVQVGGVLLAGTLYSDRSQRRAWRNSMISGIVTSALAIVTTGVSYPAGFHGCRAARRLRDGTPAGERRAQKKAEALLKETAQGEWGGRAWWNHLGALVVNGVAALVLWKAYGQSRDAWMQLGVGMVLSEAQIWTQPSRAVGDYREYRRRFVEGTQPVGLPASAPTWGLTPFPGGLGVYVHY